MINGMTKKIFCFLIAVLFIVSMIGCAVGNTGNTSDKTSENTQQSPSTDSAQPKAEAITADITLWAYIYSDTNEKFYNDAGQKLKEQHPGINLNVEMLPWDGGPNKVNISIASGTAPDLLDDYDGRISGYAGKGVLVDINDLVTDIKDKVSKKILDSVSINGKVYMYPSNGQAYAWAVNRTLAEELGVYDLLPKDHETWTYDDFKNFLKATAEKGKSKGIFGSALYAGSQSSDAITFSMLMSTGADVFNADYTKIILNSPEAVKGLDFLSNLVKERLVPPGAATMKDEDADTLFFNNKIVLAIDQSFSTISYVDSKLKAGTMKGPFDVELYEYPSFEGKPVRRASTGVGGMCLFKNDNDAMKIKASKEYMKSIFSNENLKNYVLEHQTLPVEAGIDIYADNPTLSQTAQQIIKWSDHTILNWRNVTYWSEIRTVFYPEIQAAYSGAKTSQQALDDFAKNANDIVAKNKK